LLAKENKLPRLEGMSVDGFLVQVSLAFVRPYAKSEIRKVLTVFKNHIGEGVITLFSFF